MGFDILVAIFGDPGEGFPMDLVVMAPPVADAHAEPRALVRIEARLC